MDSSSARIGFLGLGAIGQPIAVRLLDAGHEVVVFDINPAALERLTGRAIIAGSAAEVGDASMHVFGCLASPQAHRDALLGARGLQHGSRVGTYVNLGTVGTSLIRELASGLRERDIATVDAPITGGLERAGKGTLTTMTAGDRQSVRRVEPFISHYSDKIVWMGDDIGSAQVMKVLNNAVSYANLAAGCEALVVGAKAGLDPRVMLEVLNNGSGQNSATMTKIPQDVLTGRFAFGGRLEIVLKDLQAFLDEAKEQGVDPTIGPVVLQLYQAAVAHSSDAEDVTQVIRPMEIAAGTLVRSTDTATAPLDSF